MKAPILLWVNFLHPELAAPREELPRSTKEALGVVCQDTREQDNYLSKAAQRAAVHAALRLALPLRTELPSTFQPAPLKAKACHAASLMFKIVIVLMFQRFLLKRKDRGKCHIQLTVNNFYWIKNKNFIWMSRASGTKSTTTGRAPPK